MSGERSERAQEASRGEAEFDPSELEGLGVLQGVRIAQVWGLLGTCGTRDLAPGDKLLELGQPNDTLYVLLSGKLSVHLERVDREAVAFLERGQTVGELSVLEASTASAFVIAAEASRVLAVDQGTFWRLVAASHEFATNLLVLLARRLRANNAGLEKTARKMEQLTRDATVDGLTKVFNRRWLDERLPRLVQRSRRGSHSISVMMTDIDHFKRFNDNHGHAAGDVVLSAVAATFQQSVRPTDLVARYGGEELVVVLPDTNLEGALHAAERLREQVAALRVKTLDGKELPQVTISVGVACLDGEEEAFAMLERADAALYRAKHGGRNRVEH